MPYYCKACGEENDFKGQQDYIEHGQEEIFFNNDGEINELGDRDASGGNAGEWHDLECNNCGADINYYNEEELKKVKKETKKRLAKEEKEKDNWKGKLKT